MTLRLIINIVRWLWGYESLPIPEKINPDIAFLMAIGVLSDLMSVFALIYLSSTIWSYWSNRRKDGVNESLEELKCSPAPWKLKKGPGGSEVHEGHGMLAFCGVSEIYSSDKGHYSFPHLANARPISADPELYEALRLACGSCIDCDKDCSDCINFNRSWMPKARAALAKAGGAE